MTGAFEGLVVPAAGQLRVVIDGQQCEVPSGTSILEALRRVGIDLPALCHDDRLTPTGACRSCLVRVSGVARLVPACTTPLSDGMEIETSASDLLDYRRFLMSSMARGYPAGVVEATPDKPFHRCLATLGLTGQATPTSCAIDRSNPFLDVDMSRCIDCLRCVRICDDLQGQSVWHLLGRGLDTRIRPDGPTLRESGCVSCGACADTCPTGAIEDRDLATLGQGTRWTRTTCPYCGTGCEMMVGARDERIVSVRPILDAPVSKGHLCVKGRYGFDFVSSPDRVTQPMIREAGAWTTVSWREAIEFAADRLRTIARRFGPDSIGVLGSARATNEENYLTQKFARAVLGTNNVDCCARVCHAPSAAGLKQMLGAGLATGSFDDIERAGTILICGANPTENHPVLGARIKQAARHGARLVVIDPRRIELAAFGDVHLQIRPGTNVALLNALAHTILTGDLLDRDYVNLRVAGLERFAEFIAPWAPDRVAQICGVDADDIRYAARLIATCGPTLMFHGLGVTEHVQGTEGVMALINLALLTGNIGKPGAGVNPLRGQNNVQGAAHMGCDPAVLPGSTPIEGGRPTFERAWNCRLPATAGLHLMQMMDAAVEGRLKALWAVGYDVLLTNPNASFTRRALEALDFVLVQDLFLTETAREFGTVFFPACSSFEKDGTFMNAERRIQRVRKVVEPRGGSRPDWAIICNLARAMDQSDGFDFASAQDIWNEVRATCAGARGMEYSRLDEAGLQWPCPSVDHPGTQRLHDTAFANSGKAVLKCIAWRQSLERETAEFPFILITGRSLYQFNANTMTARTRLIDLRPADYLDVSPADADRLSLHEGDRVRLVSAYGTAALPIHVTSAVMAGQLFATFHTSTTFLNEVTGGDRDPTAGTPAYKMTAVRLAPVPVDDSPGLRDNGSDQCRLSVS